jgi:hypothetical protein
MDSPRSIDNATTRFLEYSDAPCKFVAVYHGIHGLWGGTDIWVCSSGKVCVRTVDARNNFSEHRFEFAVGEEEVSCVLHALINNDFVEMKVPERTAVPDEVGLRIVLTNSTGSSHDAFKWEDDAHAGFDNVRSAIARLRSQVTGMDPTYEGKYVQDFVPAGFR